MAGHNRQKGRPRYRLPLRWHPKLAEGRNYGFNGEKQGAAVFRILDEFGASHIEALRRLILRLYQHRPNTDAL